MNLLELMIIIGEIMLPLFAAWVAVVVVAVALQNKRFDAFVDSLNFYMIIALLMMQATLTVCGLWIVYTGRI